MQAMGMELVATGSGQHLRARRSARQIQGIPQQWGAQGGGVNPDLVGPARRNLHLHQTALRPVLEQGQGTPGLQG